MCLLISVSKKLSLKPSLHVWRCVEDETGQKSLRSVTASYVNVYMLLRFWPLGEEDERSPDADSLKVELWILFLCSSAVIISQLPATFHSLRYPYYRIFSKISLLRYLSLSTYVCTIHSSMGHCIFRSFDGDWERVREKSYYILRLWARWQVGEARSYLCI